MKISWKSAGLFVLGSVTMALVGVLGSVTHGDVVRYHNWIDPAHVASTQLGQYYIIKDDGTVLDPLCELRAVDFDPPLQPQSMPGRSYVNSLGQLTPVVIQLVGAVMPVVPHTANADAGTASVSHVLTFQGVKLETATATSLRRLTTRVLAEQDIAGLEKPGHDARPTTRAAFRPAAWKSKRASRPASPFVRLTRSSETHRPAYPLGSVSLRAASHGRPTSARGCGPRSNVVHYSAT